MQYSDGIIILPEVFMSAIRTIVLIFICISLVYTLCIALFMGSTFKHFKSDSMVGFIPFYNAFALLKLMGLPWFYGLLQFTPIGNIAFIIFLNARLTEYFDKVDDYVWGLTFLPFIYMGNLPTEVGKKKRATAASKRKETPKVEKYSMKSLDTNLLTDKELENLNKQKVEEEGVDSIFKADIDMIEKAAPYKAGKQKMKVVEDDPVYERETIKRVETVKARDIKRDGRFINEEDVIEKIDL